MRKICILMIALLATSFTLSAQSMYLRLGVGGGIGLGYYAGNSFADRSTTQTSDNYTVKSLGLGTGFNANLAFGYMMNEYMGFELGLNEFFGLPRKTHSTLTTTFANQTLDDKWSGMMFQVVPAFILTPGLEKVNPYARIGFIIGVLPAIVENYTSTGTTAPESSVNESYRAKYYGGLAVGFTAAGGAQFTLNEKISLYAEIVFNGINYAPKKGKYTEWTIDGSDHLATATTKEKEWIYVKERDIAETIPDTDPDKVFKESYTFSNVLINFGVKFRFGKEMAKK
jgi:hypothetical protein